MIKRDLNMQEEGQREASTRCLLQQECEKKSRTVYTVLSSLASTMEEENQHYKERKYR